MTEKQIKKGKKEIKIKEKILFVYPPSPVMNREDRCQQPTKELLVIPPLPPTDLMYMAAVAENVGLEAKIVDYSLIKNAREQLNIDLESFQPNYIVANISSTTFANDMEIFDIAKKLLSSVTTIAKGAHFLSTNMDVLYQHKSLDLIMVGEVEETLKEILQKKQIAKIKGVCYRDGFAAKYTGKRPFIQDLDKIPFPARHLVDNSIYKRPDNGKTQAIIKVSRGCPHHCFFCLATPVSGSKVRMRSPENIMEEIKLCVNKYKITNFLFWSDIFNQDREWVLDLCEAIIDSGLKITWSANTRADTADDEMAEFMYDAGCRLVSIGVESGSQFILDKIGKKITIEQIKKTVKLFKENKIKVYNYFVLGLPWDTEDTIEETIDFAIRLNSDFVSFYTAAPLPGTRFFKFAVENNLLSDKDTFDGAYYNPIINTLCLSKNRVFELHKNAIRRFYLRPGFIFKAISNIRSFSELKNYFKAGLGLIFRR